MTLDKQSLYGRFLASQQRQEKLADLATRKALDLPVEDDVQITNTHHHAPNMPVTLALIGSTLLSGGAMTAGLGSALGWFDAPAEVKPPAAQLAAPAAEQEFRVTFYGEDGQEIEVSHP